MQKTRHPICRISECFLVWIMMITISACRPAHLPLSAETVIPHTQVPVETVASIIATSTSTLIPVPLTMTPPQPTATKLPVPLPDPEDLPAFVGESLPESSEVLQVNNAGYLRLLGLWGLGSPQALVWSPDGNLLAAAFQAGVYLFDADSGKEMTRIRTSGDLAGMSFSPGGEKLAIIRQSGMVEFYDRQGLLKGTLDAGINRPVSLTYSPDGEYLYIGMQGGMVAVVEVQDHETIVSTVFGDYGYPPEEMVFSSDGLLYAGPSGGQGLGLWHVAEAENPQLIGYLPGSAGLLEMTGLAFSSDGRWLAAGNLDGVLLLWELPGQELPGQAAMLWPFLEGYDAPGIWQSVAISPDSLLLATGGDNGDVWLWDLESSSPLRAVELGSEPVEKIAFSPDGQTLAVILADGSVLMIDPATLEVIMRLETGPAWLGSQMAIAGEYFATATQARLGDGDFLTRVVDPTGLYLRSLMDGSLVRKLEVETLAFPPGGFASLVFSPDGSALAASPLGLPPVIWETASGKVIHTYQEVEGGAPTCTDLALTDEFLAGACMDRQIYLWETWTGFFIGALQGHGSTVQAVAFSPDGRLLASGDAHSQVRIWNPADGTVVREINVVEPSPITDLVFSPDGSHLAVANTRDYPKVSLWDVSSGEQQDFLGFNDTVSAVAFSQDGSMLAVVVHFEFRDQLELYDLSSGDLLTALEYYQPITNIAFSADGHFIITISQEGIVRLWGVILQ